MADELTVSIALAFSKSGRRCNTQEMGLNGVEIDVAGTDFIGPFTQTIGTTVEALELGDITAPGYIAVKNRDATNFVSLRNGSGGANLVELQPGDIACFRLATTTPYAIADTASCELLMLIVED